MDLIYTYTNEGKSLLILVKTNIFGRMQSKAWKSMKLIVRLKNYGQNHSMLWQANGTNAHILISIYLSVNSKDKTN